MAWSLGLHPVERLLVAVYVAAGWPMCVALAALLVLARLRGAGPDPAPAPPRIVVVDRPPRRDVAEVLLNPPRFRS